MGKRGGSMEEMGMNFNFYKGKTVLVTGHTGFKGSWLCKSLSILGANVIGYSLDPPTEPSLYDIVGLADQMISVIGDIRDRDKLISVVEKYRPEIVIHMAAQPLVRESYVDPAYTYETNVMGTVNVCEAIRSSSSVRSFVNVTTDKVYKNNEWEWGYRENDVLNGFDPYSNSKSCSELVTSSYNNSFFLSRGIAVSTCRAGNVIGGGDFAKDRIIPDCVRAAANNETIIIRNPYSIRPFQHVMEPVSAYLYLAEQQYYDSSLAGSYNIGPDECDCVTVGTLADIFCECWGNGVSWKNVCEVGAPHEASFLKLDCSRIKKVLKWKPHWNIVDAVKKTVEWSKCYIREEDMNGVMEKQITEFLGEM